MPIRILHLEDSPHDAEIIQDKLEAGGLACDIVGVDNQAQFTAALESESFDLVLCDYNLPNYDGLSALKQAREKHPETPVILISGSLGEDEAVKCLQHGATDYLLKQRLDRLPAAVKRAVQGATELRQRRQVEEKLAASERRLRAIIDTEPACVKLLDAAGSLLEMNPAGLEMIEADSLEQVKNHCVYPLVVEEDRAAYRELVAQVFRGESGTLEFQITSLKGRRRWLDVHATPLRDEQGRVAALLGVTRDITERKWMAKMVEQTHARLLRQNAGIMKLAQVEAEAEGDLSRVLAGVTEIAARTLQTGRVSVWLFTLDRSAIRAHDLFELAEGRHSSGVELRGHDFPAYFAAMETGETITAHEAATDPRTREFAEPYLRPLGITALLDTPIRWRGRIVGVVCHEHIGSARQWQPDEVAFANASAGVVTTALEAGERKQAEEKLNRERALLRTLVDLLPDHIYVKDAQSRFLLANKGVAQVMGVANPDDLIGKSDRDFYPPTDSAVFRNDEQSVLSGHARFDKEEPVLHPDGTQRFILTTKVPLKDADGNITGLVGIGRDFTERKRTEQLLAWEKSALELIASAASLGETLDGLMLGLEKQLPGALCSVLLLDADEIHLRHGAGPSLPEAYNRLIDGVAIGPNVGSCGTAAYTNRQVIVADIGSDPLWAAYRELALGHGLRACWSTPIHSGQGKILGTFAIYNRRPCHPAAAELELIERAKHIVSLAIERKRAEEQLRQSEAKLANAHRMAKLGHWELDLRNLADVEQVCNLSPDAVPGSSDGLQSRPTVEQVWNLSPDAVPGSSDGLQSRPTVEQVCNLSPDAVPGRSDGLQSRPTVEQVWNLSPDAGLQSRPTGSNRLQWSDEVFRIFGYQPGEIEVSNENFFRAVHPDDRPRIQAAMSQAIRERQPYNLIHRIVLPDGTQRIVQEQSEIQMDESSGQPLKMVGTVQDITELKTAEQALQESEFLYHSLMEHLPLGVFRKDLEGRFTFVNPRFCVEVGKPLAELLGQTDTAIAPAELARKYQADDRQVMATGKTLEAVEENRFTPGKIRFNQVLKAPLYNLAGEVAGIQGIFLDVTRHKELEEQLRQSQKLEAIGQLAGGVAHDFNNILQAIIGFAALARSPNLDPAVRDSHLQEVLDASARAAELTRQLLIFGRKQALRPQVLNVNDSVRNVTKMLQRLIGEDITLQCAFAPTEPLVLADAGMIDQIFLNLSVNARDAMPQGGRLVVATAVVELNAEQAQRHPDARAGRFVCLSVQDTGSGIAPEHLAHIFEPFFTTKKLGEGTGLGLATVFGIVQQHHGWMEVESAVGAGTTFKVYLPATADAPAPAPEVVRKVRGGKETILVVEDDEVLRRIVLLVLRKQGYRVLEAASGVKALAVWEAHATEIDLLLTDLMMPEGLTGRELAEQLRAKRPGLKVIYTSGYSPELAGPNLALKEGLNFLQKPYPPPKLAQTVRDCLDD